MGDSNGKFFKYPRTPHVLDSKGTVDDRHLGRGETLQFLANPSLIIEEKLDGTNVGIHFESTGELVMQCRGHEITSGMHPQYDLFKQWVQARRPTFENLLQDRLILYGEWLYARHSIHYRALPHYFFEFDIFDKSTEQFLDLEHRTILLEGTGLRTVPVLRRGPVTAEELPKLIGASAFDASFQNPRTGRVDNLMEGLYLRTEADGLVTGRAKYVRPEFIERLQQSEHWQHTRMVSNLLRTGLELWSC